MSREPDEKPKPGEQHAQPPKVKAKAKAKTPVADDPDFMRRSYEQVCSKVHPHHALGEGSYGAVYECVFRDPMKESELGGPDSSAGVDALKWDLQQGTILAKDMLDPLNDPDSLVIFF